MKRFDTQPPTQPLPQQPAVDRHARVTSVFDSTDPFQAVTRVCPSLGPKEANASEANSREVDDHENAATQAWVSPSYAVATELLEQVAVAPRPKQRVTPPMVLACALVAAVVGAYVALSQPSRVVAEREQTVVGATGEQAALEVAAVEKKAELTPEERARLERRAVDELFAGDAQRALAHYRELFERTGDPAFEAVLRGLGAQ